MKILYFLGILTFLAVYNFVEKSYKLRQQTSDNIGQERYQIDDDAISNDEDIFENMWEKSGQFEGDIILTDTQKEILTSMTDSDERNRNVVKSLYKKWPNNILVYEIQDKNFSIAQVDMIKKAFDKISNVSCVKFRQSVNNTDKDVVQIKGIMRIGCMSLVGLKGGPQFLNLDSTHPVNLGCFTLTSIIHELLHALGFFHQHNSLNRDNYIKVVWENIQPDKYKQFKKVKAKQATDFGLKYDYNSVMHYSKKAFTKNGNQTIIPIQEGVKIVRHKPLSKLDIEKLNLLYCR